MYQSILKTLASYADRQDYETVVSTYSKSYFHRALRRGDTQLAYTALRHIRKRDYDLKILRRLVKYALVPTSRCTEKSALRSVQVRNSQT